MYQQSGTLSCGSAEQPGCWDRLSVAKALSLQASITGNICIFQVLFYKTPKENKAALKAKIAFLRTDLVLCCLMFSFLLHLLQG